VFDILGKEITSYKIENGIVIIKDLAINQIYFVCGYSSDRQLVFTQKVYFSE
jgi:predicted transcriptional regulator